MLWFQIQSTVFENLHQLICAFLTSIWVIILMISWFVFVINKTILHHIFYILCFVVNYGWGIFALFFRTPHVSFTHIYKKSWQWMLALGFACLHYVSSSSVKIIYMVLKLVVKDTWGVLKKRAKIPERASTVRISYKYVDIP
jgi:hypothetical protein